MKRNSLRTITCTLAAVSLLSLTAFATEPSMVTGANVAATPPASTNQPAKDAVKDTAKNALVSGTVTEVTEKDGNYSIQIKNDDMGMVFHVQKGVFVINAKDHATMNVADIKKDMKITAVLAKNSPMTLSIPPQTPGAVGFILNTEETSVELGVFNDELTNEANTLKLNIDKTTPIVSANGAKKIYSADDLKGSELLALYTITTRSIPAQTTPSFVMIMNTAEDLKAAEDNATTPETTVPEKVTFSALRTAAESKGYTIAWTSNRAPITVTKGETVYSIEIDKTAYTVNGAAKTFTTAPKLENGVTMVPQEFINLL